MSSLVLALLAGASSITGGKRPTSESLNNDDDDDESLNNEDDDDESERPCGKSTMRQQPVCIHT